MYTLSYTVRLDPPVRSSYGEIADHAEYKTHVVVAKPGTKRVFNPQWFGSHSRPTAVVGDTLILPVHTDAGRTNHRFPMIRRGHAGDPVLYQGDAPPDLNDWTLRTIDEVPAVRMTVAPQLALVNSWRGMSPGGVEHAWYSAYLEFATPGSFNLASRFSHEPAGAPGRQSVAALMCRQVAMDVPSYPFRVVPAGQPVTVLLEAYTTTHQYRSGGESSRSERLPYGTQEVRVGDTVVLECGIDIDPPANGDARSAVVETLPLRDVPHHTPR